jgi:hypothetical protein
LAERLSALYEHAGSPTYKAITAHGLTQRPAVKFADATLSGWLAGETVPADASAFAVLVTWLEIRAGRWPGHQALDVREWKALRAAAWRERQASRRPGPDQGLDEQVRGYLEAARKAAEQHPYPGAPGHADPPSLAEVYVRQCSRPAAQGSHDLARSDDPAAAGREIAVAAAVEPAEVVFRKERVCVLIAGPGAGKSSLLRTWLHEAAGHWLDGTQHAGMTGAAVPVWVSARALTGEETSIPDALATATGKLCRYGRDPALDKTRFLQPPCPDACWLLLVDGLDELPNAAERRGVLEKLANAIGGDPVLYRCVVATRPLAENELDVLDQAQRDQAPRYDLQPFTADDLHAYTGKYFGTRWAQDEADRRAGQFTGALRRVRLAELARTPLMAFMLCQLYLADPESPLPDGRSGVYEAFTRTVYDDNHGKQVAASQKEAIKQLVEGFQTGPARQEAGKAARQIYTRLPELVDYLAFAWLSGRQAPAAATLASSHQVLQCPGRVQPARWNAFVEDLLRHTGLLVHHADGLGFAHQTFLEYHAARHATRDHQARRRTLRHLFTPAESATGWQHQAPSYLGFLLDRLLGPGDDQISQETTQCLEDLAASGGKSACEFLVRQVELRTNLPTESTAHHLTCFAAGPTLTRYDRMRAAKAVAEIDAGRGRKLLSILASNPFDVHESYEAAKALSQLESCQNRSAPPLSCRVTDGTAPLPSRTGALSFELSWVAKALAEIGVERCARLLQSYADDTTLADPSRRLLAARMLAEVDGYRDHGARLLEALAASRTIYASERMRAAEVLAQVDADRGARLLERFAHDTRLTTARRLQAARVLAEVDVDRGVRQYESLANDLTFAIPGRLQAADALAQLDRHRNHGAQLLEALAADQTLEAADRMWAAGMLARVSGYRNHGVRSLEALAADQTLKSSDRIWASRKLAELPRDDGRESGGRVR